MTTAKKNRGEKYIPKMNAFGIIDGDMSSRIADELQAYEGSCDHVDMRLNTPGGSTGNGTAIYNTIKGSDVPVDIYIVGMAASMGALVALAGRKVFISKYGQIMIHEGRYEEGGTSSELRDMANNADAVNANMLAMIVAKTKMSEDDAKAKFFNGKDNWFNAKEALALGLVDGIYDLDEVKGLEAASHVEVYAICDAAYQKGVFNNKNIAEMEDIQLSKEVVACLGLKKGYDVVAIEKAVLKMRAENDELTDKLEEVEKESVTKEVTALLDGAKGKITAKQRTLFAKQYESDPEGLKEILATCGFTSVLDGIKQEEKGGAFSPEVQAMMAEGWDKLDRTDRLRDLKALSEDGYNALYKNKLGYLPNEKPKPFMRGDSTRRK